MYSTDKMKISENVLCDIFGASKDWHMLKVSLLYFLSREILQAVARECLPAVYGVFTWHRIDNRNPHH